MKTILAVLIWTFIADCNAIELNATSLLEGKLKRIQYFEERANELRFLACLHINDYSCIATGFVIATYLVMTSNGALYAQDPITHVMILNTKRHVDKQLYEARDGSVTDVIESGSFNHHLAVLTLKEEAGVVPIKFSRKGKRKMVDFVEETQLELAGFTEHGPGTLDLMVIKEEDKECNEEDIPLYIVNTASRNIRNHVYWEDRGSPILKENFLVGVLTFAHYEKKGPHLSRKEGYYMTKITDHAVFMEKVWAFNRPPENSAIASNMEGCSG